MRVRPAIALALIVSGVVLTWGVYAVCSSYYNFTHTGIGPSATELRALVLSHRDTLDRIRAILLADPEGSSNKSVIDSSTSVGVSEWYVERRGALAGSILGYVYASGNVVTGLTVSIAWLPPDLIPVVRRITRDSDGRRVWVQLDGEWWGFWQR